MSSSNSSCNYRTIWVDLIRAIAIFFVIVLHVAAPIVYQWGRVPKSWWHLANAIDSLTRICVPLFLMISGALLLGKNETFKDFFLKRFNKIAIPWGIWSIFYLLWSVYFQRNTISFLGAVKLLLEGKVYFHLGFLYLLVGLYLLTPIINKFVRSANEQDMKYFIGIWFTCTALVPLVSRFGNINIAIRPPELTGFIGYFLLGYILKDQKVKTRGLGIAVVVFSGMAIFTDLGTFFLIKKTGSIDEYFYNYLAPNVIIASISSFIMIKNIGERISAKKTGLMENALIFMGRASFGIYLVHVIWLELLSKGTLGFVLSGTVNNPILMIPVTSFAVFTLSGISVWILSKIPLLNTVVGMSNVRRSLVFKKEVTHT